MIMNQESLSFCAVVSIHEMVLQIFFLFTATSWNFEILTKIVPGIFSFLKRWPRDFLRDEKAFVTYLQQKFKKFWASALALPASSSYTSQKHSLCVALCEWKKTRNPTIICLCFLMGKYFIWYVKNSLRNSCRMTPVDVWLVLTNGLIREIPLSFCLSDICHTTTLGKTPHLVHMQTVFFWT